MSDPAFGSIPPSWQRVMDLWDAGEDPREIARVTGFSLRFVQTVTCTLDERDDGVATDSIRDGSILLVARLLQCFPHLPDRRRAA